MMLSALSYPYELKTVRRHCKQRSALPKLGYLMLVLPVADAKLKNKRSN
jgi:hypothetical protein